MRPALAVQSLADALVESMRDRILRGEIPTGSPISEAVLAREYDVARPTAKGAIERLVSIGLLARPPHKSARVPELGARDIADVYLARRYLESMAAQSLAARAAVPEAAERAIERLREADLDAVSDLVEPDIAFHRELVDAVGSQRISLMHRTIMGEMQLSMAQVQAHHLLDRDVILADHSNILDKIRSGDPAAAAAAVDQHLNRACGVLLRHFEQR
ncbi:MAG: GntR family transcriptional regulator [Marmoricola sp.]|nr:GntR family transcriptional regulator [Marmoricola sp.]